MSIELPAKQRIYTTTYSDFRGVDYTSDATNVWRRRSPSGVNMLPDASGRPFKRKGWEVAKDSYGNEINASYLGEMIGTTDEVRINKCFYFELAGCDHIIIFAEGGVFKLIRTEITEEGQTTRTVDELSLLDTELGSTEALSPDCYGSWARTFFFEGGGKSAFYIYGEYKVWIYEWTGERFKFGQAEYKYPNMTSGIEIPRVLIGATAECEGTVLEGYNLVGNLASVEYQNNSLFHYGTQGDILASVDQATFTTQLSSKGVYEFSYDGTNWKYNGSTVTLSTYGIEIIVGTATSGDMIKVINKFGVMLPNNVSQQQVGECKCYITKVTQFDKPMEVIAEMNGGTPNVPSSTEVVLHTETDLNEKIAWVEFDADYSTTSQEDTIKVIFPMTEVNITTYDGDTGHEPKAIMSGGTTTFNW